ncbi:MAG: hypothetical protein V1755_15495 [Chloroflexota bacterium]
MKNGLVCQGDFITGDFVTTYCVETGVDDSSLWGFNAGIVHFGEGVADFGNDGEDGMGGATRRVFT